MTLFFLVWHSETFEKKEVGNGMKDQKHKGSGSGNENRFKCKRRY